MLKECEKWLKGKIIIMKITKIIRTAKLYKTQACSHKTKWHNTRAHASAFYPPGDCKSAVKE